MTNIEEKLENIESKINDLDPETGKQARKRQPWMPIAGSLICGALLMLSLILFAEWI